MWDVMRDGDVSDDWERRLICWKIPEVKINMVYLDPELQLNSIGELSVISPIEIVS